MCNLNYIRIDYEKAVISDSWKNLLENHELGENMRTRTDRRWSAIWFESVIKRLHRRSPQSLTTIFRWRIRRATGPRPFSSCRSPFRVTRQWSDLHLSQVPVFTEHRSLRLYPWIRLERFQFVIIHADRLSRMRIPTGVRAPSDKGFRPWSRKEWESSRKKGQTAEYTHEDLTVRPGLAWLCDDVMLGSVKKLI